MLNSKNQDILWGNVFDSLEDLENEDVEINEAEELEKQKRAMNRRYEKLSGVFWVVFTLLFIFFLWLFFYNKYISLNTKDSLEPAEQEYISSFKTYLEYGMWLFVEKSQIQSEFNPDFNKQSWEKIISDMNNYKEEPTVSYIQKREAMNKFVSSLFNMYKNDSQEIEKKKSDIWLYWFLPNEIDKVMEDSAIQRSFLSIEAIKFFTALQVYSNIDSFITEFSTFAWITKEDVKNKMLNIVNSWEINVQKYLNMCYLNPYEVNENCDTIRDFDYEMAKKSQQIEIPFFKALMLFIKQKLENQDYPKLWIVFNSLDPKSNTISFTITINTFLEDELYLVNSWIINPHIYIVSLLINGLRESHFILWDTIKIDTLKVTKRNIGEVVLNTSSFTFNIPVQKAVEREIYDFVYNK